MVGEDLIWLNTKVMLQHVKDRHPSPFWVAFDLASLHCMPFRPIVWDPVALAAALKVFHPSRARSARWLRQHATDVLHFFVPTDGGYLPDPAWLMLRDPNAAVN